MSSLHSTMLSLQMPDVPHGIGTTKFALLALKIGFSMLINYAFPFLTNVKSTMLPELALHATKVMTSLMELASSPHSTTPSPPTQDAVNGTGTTKSAWLAPKTGSSMPIKSAFPFQTNALLMMLLAFA